MSTTRRDFLRGSAGLAGATLLGGWWHEAAEAVPPEATAGWDACPVRHTLPTVGAHRMLLKVSFRRPARHVPRLKVGHETLRGGQTDSAGRYWQLDAHGLRADHSYRLRLVAANGRHIAEHLAGRGERLPDRRRLQRPDRPPLLPLELGAAERARDRPAPALQGRRALQAMRPGATRYRSLAVATVLLLGALAALPAGALARRPRTRAVLVVSNNWSGTADIVSLRTLRRLKRLNVIPDKAARLAEIDADPTRRFYFDNIRTLVGEGHNQYVDDGFPSKDGRRIYFSRPSFADVVAIDVRSGRIAWRVPVDGYRADHMALSPSGRRLLVSASTERTVDVIDTARGRIVHRIPSGDSPHESHYSRDGRRIFHASIGLVYTNTDDPAQDATKGERIFEIVDARTYEVLRRVDMGRELAAYGLGASAAVRPMAISPDERYAYFQLSFLHGFVEYDLRARRVSRIALLPIAPPVRRLPREDYLLDSAMHGLALNRNGTRFCVAGTMSGYAAIVSRRTLRPIRTIKVGRVPYWSTSSPGGRYCFVSVARNDRVAVIGYARARLVRFIHVGFHPQRMRTGRLRVSALR